MSYKKSLLDALNATCRDFPRCIPSLLYGWRACLLYASLVTGYGCLSLRVSCHSIQPIQNTMFFGKNVQKIIFVIMGGSKYFTYLFRPQFSEHAAQFQHSGAPSGKVGPPFKLINFFWPEYCSTIDVSSRNGWTNVIEIGPKVYIR
jgi:hypothetical protein